MQNHVDRLFSGLPPSAFRCTQGDGVRIVCAGEVRPPHGWSEHWGAIAVTTNPKTQQWLSTQTFSDTSAFVLVADIADDEQFEAVVRLGEHLCEHPDVAPPTFLLPLASTQPGAVHADEEATAGGVPRSRVLDRIESLLVNSYVDDVLPLPVAGGFALALAVSAKLQSLAHRLSGFEDELVRRSERSVKHQGVLVSVHRACWDYSRKRIFQAIPPMREQTIEQGNIVDAFELGAPVMSSPFGVIITAFVPEGTLDADEQLSSLLLIEKGNVKQLAGMKMINSSLRAMETLRNFPHPNLPQLMDVFQTPRRVVVHMAYLGDCTLFARMRQRDCPAFGAQPRPLGAEVVTSAVAQMASAIYHLHTAVRIAHRDLKPENIIIREDVAEGGGSGSAVVEVKIAGFELATPEASSQLPCGTMPFAAPEVILAGTTTYACMPADIWSFGVLVMELVCGLRSISHYVPDDVGLQDAQVAVKCFQPPSHRVGHQVKDVFAEDTFLERFFARSAPELGAVKSWLVPWVAGMVRVSPVCRTTAEELWCTALSRCRSQQR
mmetsp:Transcript_22896/g.66147  ORF Transcript_22896/g.66147 Transcript_22896/m.66147 type:complete len:549 (+) Transcript_22896:124-1770(+)